MRKRVHSTTPVGIENERSLSEQEFGALKQALRMTKGKSDI
jgi:hypothetical protein